MEKGFRKIINCLAFIAIFFIGTVLLINWAFGAKIPNVTSALMQISTVIAFFVTCVNAYYFVRSKRNGVYLLLYLIAVILIAVCYFFPLLKGV